MFAVILMVIRFIPGFKPAGFLFFFLLMAKAVNAQVMVSGRVYDSTKLYVVPGVVVKSTGGGSTMTDSLGAYHINTSESDSISFYYANKPTQKFPVKSISNYNDFDISLQVRVLVKYKLLKEVKVFTKSYKQDSASNRVTYSKVFQYQNPTLRSSSTPGTPPGLDINELINIFRFRKNRQNLAFQNRLIAEEEEKYVNYKFNSTLLKRVTGLSGPALDKYKLMYRPSYEFLITTSELAFYEYILNSADKFKREEGQK